MFISALADCFYWILSNSKSAHVSRTLLSILADLKNAVVGIVTASSSISKLTSPFKLSLGIVPSALIKIGNLYVLLFSISFYF